MSRRVTTLLSTFLLASAASMVPIGTAGAAAAPRVGSTCSTKLIGTRAVDAKAQPIVCTRLTKTKAQWKLIPLGSFERPIPLGQIAEAGPVASRFRVRVTRVNLSAASEIVAESPEMTPPAPGTDYVRVAIEATFAGPAASGVVEHVWFARDDSGATSAASEGCGGGYGGGFEIGATVAKGSTIAGTHCFTVAATSVASLRLRVDGYGDRPDVYFALR